MSDGYRPIEKLGPVRTDLHCHQCSKSFIAELDYAIDGNHVIECPYCGHEHCRVIQGGKITGDRWDTRADRVAVEPRCVWKASTDVLQGQTSTVSHYIRSAWLNATGDLDFGP